MTLNERKIEMWQVGDKPPYRVRIDGVEYVQKDATEPSLIDISVTECSSHEECWCAGRKECHKCGQPL